MHILGIQKALLIACLIFGNAGACSQIQKSLVGFQDIPWDTKLNQVKVKFPSIKNLNVCQNNRLKEFAIKSNLSCTQLTRDYIVDGVSFTNDFIFDASDQLKRVELRHMETNSTNDPTYSDDICHILFKRLENLLESRYGTSLNVANSDPMLFWGRSEYKAWLPLPTELFISKSFDNKHPVNDVIEDKDLKSCEVQITYNPRVSTEAKKL